MVMHTYHTWQGIPCRMLATRTLYARPTEHDTEVANNGIPFVIVPEDVGHGQRFPVYDRTCPSKRSVIEGGVDRPIAHSALENGDGIMVSFVVLRRPLPTEPETIFLAINVVKVFRSSENV